MSTKRLASTSCMSWCRFLIEVTADTRVCERLSDRLSWRWLSVLTSTSLDVVGFRFYFISSPAMGKGPPFCESKGVISCVASYRGIGS